MFNIKKPLSRFSALLLIFFGMIITIFSVPCPTIRVLLEKKKLTHDNLFLWNIYSENGFWLIDTACKKKRIKCPPGYCKIRIKNGLFVCGKFKIVSKKLLLEPINSMLQYGGKKYFGSLSIGKDQTSSYLINHIPLEDYVCSVLKSESWPGWSLEVNKASAIVYRTYAVEKMLRAKDRAKSGETVWFDIGCTNLDQTYKGFCDNHLLRTATKETEGIIITYKGKPIVAMYDTCCGGLIPSKMKNAYGKEYHYLARPYACTYCTDCKVFSWNVTYTPSDCLHILRSSDHRFTAIEDIKVSLVDKAGVVQSVMIKNNGSWKTLPRKTIYALFKDIKSFCFSIKKSKKGFQFSGRGYGHHLGMCQWGAKKMVEAGFDYKNILKFYYPNISFKKLIQK